MGTAGSSGPHNIQHCGGCGVLVGEPCEEGCPEKLRWPSHQPKTVQVLGVEINLEEARKYVRDLARRYEAARNALINMEIAAGLRPPRIYRKKKKRKEQEPEPAGKEG